MKNYYQILGVAQDATEDEIKHRYRKRAKLCHPDIVGDDPEKRQQFELLTKAYEVIGNKESREKYDQELAGQSQSKPKETKSTARKSTAPPDFSKIYEEFFHVHKEEKSEDAGTASKIKTDEMFQSFFRPKK